MTNWNYVYLDASFVLANLNAEASVYLCAGHSSDAAAVFKGQDTGGYFPPSRLRCVYSTTGTIVRPNTPYKIDISSLSESYNIYLYAYMQTGSGTKSVKANIFNWYLSKT